MRRTVLTSFLAFACIFSYGQTVIKIDLSAERGPIKPMNAANNGPVEADTAAYQALRIP